MRISPQFSDTGARIAAGVWIGLSILAIVFALTSTGPAAWLEGVQAQLSGRISRALNCLILIVVALPIAYIPGLIHDLATCQGMFEREDQDSPRRSRRKRDRSAS